MLAGAAVSWKSTKQSIIAQSSMEAEYIALAEAAKEVEWLRKLQQEIFPKANLLPTKIYEDNQSAIALAKNPPLNEIQAHCRALPPNSRIGGQQSYPGNLQTYSRYGCRHYDEEPKPTPPCSICGWSGPCGSC